MAKIKDVFYNFNTNKIENGFSFSTGHIKVILDNGLELESELETDIVPFARDEELFSKHIDDYDTDGPICEALGRQMVAGIDQYSVPDNDNKVYGEIKDFDPSKIIDDGFDEWIKKNEM